MGYFRHPQTTQERRQWYSAEEMRSEYPDIKGCRRRRSEHNMPNWYDDIYRHPYSRRSWKYYRDHQYKVKEEPHQKEERPHIEIDAQAINGRRWYSWRKTSERHYFRVRNKYRRYRFDKWDGFCLQTEFTKADDLERYCRWKRRKQEEAEIKSRPSYSWLDQLYMAQSQAQKPFDWLNVL